MEDNNREIAIKISGVRKKYKLGQIGGGTLKADMESWWAKVRGKEDPNSVIGEDKRSNGTVFMALNGVDLTIYKGEAIGIIGSNGAGKSTLLKILSRVTAPTDGEIDLYGRITSMLEVGTGFSGELTGRENVYMNGAILGMTKAEIDAKMEQIIEFSEVREFIDTPVKRYSSGMFVKLAFSVASHLDSEIMIMDEVLAVGDVNFQTKCLNKMRDAANNEGRTVLYVSHNMNTIRTLCDRCIVLDKGKIIFDGDVEKAINHYLKNDDDNNFPVYFDYTESVRDYHFGKEIFVNSLRLIGKDVAQYKVSEEIPFEITLDSNIDIHDIQIIMRIKEANNVTKIAAALSESFSIKKGENILRFSLDLEGLVEDRYCLSFEIIKKDNAGGYFSYDNPYAKILVLITETDTGKIFWSKKYWGNVKLNDIKLLN